jgi:hypothetical protein
MHSSVSCLRMYFRWVFKIRKANVSFVMSVCLSVRPSVCVSVFPHGATRLSLDGFSWNLIFEYFSKICGENLSFMNWSWIGLSVSSLLHIKIFRSSDIQGAGLPVFEARSLFLTAFAKVVLCFLSQSVFVSLVWRICPLLHFQYEKLFLAVVHNSVILILYLCIAYKNLRSFSCFAIRCTVFCGQLTTVYVDLCFVFTLRYHREEFGKVTSHIFCNFFKICVLYCLTYILLVLKTQKENTFGKNVKLQLYTAFVLLLTEGTIEKG